MTPKNVLQESFNFEKAINSARSEGYYFSEDALDSKTLEALNKEITGLELAANDDSALLNPGRANQVRQSHERKYVEFGDKSAPTATWVAFSLARIVREYTSVPELRKWLPNEIGYQRYHKDSGFIDPHRDRASDKLLGVTFTLSGSAKVKIFEPLGEPDDYSNLRQVDEFQAEEGGIMLLRAKGLGNGERTIHQVLPPTSSERSVLNLRMRPDILG